MHVGLVQLSVYLSPGAPHSRALASVEHLELDASQVSDFTHQPIESVDLLHQDALAYPTNGRVARTRTDCRQRWRDEGSVGPSPG